MTVKYPHMLPHETRIWDRLIENSGLPEGKIDYDVHLGEGAPIDPAWPGWMVRMVQRLSTHRADVVVERDDEVVIIEIKSIAGMGAVGQLVGYEALYLRQYGVDRPVRLLCVCERLEADIKAVFSYYEIEVIELGVVVEAIDS